MGLAFLLLSFGLTDLTAQDEATPLQNPPPFGYTSIAQVDQQMQGFGARELAHTTAGRSLWLATFGARDQPGRPAVLVVANLDGDRPVGTETALRLCEHLQAGSPLLDVVTVHVIALGNPDGAAHALAGAGLGRGVSIDDDHDGRVDEDGPEDIDGDGRVLQMMVSDPGGEWLADGDPLRFYEADRDKGEYGNMRLEVEGRDNDGDRVQAEDGAGGVVLEANFPHRWQEHQARSGAFQLSEPESRAIADFVLAKQHLALVIVLGAEDNLATAPSGKSSSDKNSTEPREEDVYLLKVLGERLYDGLEVKPRGADHGKGNFADWVYFQVGIPVLESAVWSPPMIARADLDHEDEADDGADTGDGDGDDDDESESPSTRSETEQDKIRNWADQTLTEGFIPWKVLPGTPMADIADGAAEVFVGGWLPLVEHNPPSGELESIGTRWIEFIDTLAPDFATLQLAEPLRIKDLGSGLLDVEATVVNPNLLPTMSRMGEVTRRHVPVRAILELPTGGEILSGQRMQALPRLQGLGGSSTLHWLIRLPEGKNASIRLMSRTSGELSITIPGAGS
jgi:zinc carboxypeptidase